jgi:conjugative transfer signal peptidase TraF
MRDPQRILFGTAGLLAVGLLGLRLPDVVLWNDTGSMPVGLYQRTHGEVALGSIVTLRAHRVADAYARARGAGFGFRLLKRIAATSGNIVCGDGDPVLIDGEVRALRRTRDTSGRVLPSWFGCRRLSEGQYLVLGDSPDSFDSRYFGIVSGSEIEGVWSPLFLTQHQNN